MRTSAFVIGALGIATGWVACTGSYGDFDFGGATSSAGPSGSGASGATGGMGGAGASGGEGAVGGSAPMGSGGASGGAPADGAVACGEASCDLRGGGHCCIPKTGAPTCETSGSECTGNEVTVFCDGPADCPGQLCCGSLQMGDLTSLECASSCSQADQAIICDPAGPDQCVEPTTCQESTQLGPDYHVCK